MHVWLAQAVAAPQVPVALHVSVLLPTHCFEAGEHVTQALPRQAGVVPEHVTCVTQVPVVLQD